MLDHHQKDLNNSIYDGVFANMFATLTGGVFLTGFALYLGMNEFLIGLLAAIPFFATIFQLPAAYYISRNGKRKQVACRTAAVARLTWIPVLLTATTVSIPTHRSLFILILIFCSHTFASISYVT